MNYDHQAREDFEHATRKAWWRKVLRWLTGRPGHLLSYDEIRSRVELRGQHYLGLQNVPLEKIIGSVGRYQDFDREFLPTQTHTKERWVNVDKAYYADRALPPVDLLKIGEVYFVRDGNHRISVARQRGQAFIDAYVTEIDVPVSVTTDTGLDDLAVAQERLDFLEATHLDILRPEGIPETRVPGQYPRLLEHIHAHHWFLGTQRNETVPWEEAVTSWFDGVYQPVVQILQEHDLLESFPGCSLADLYLWVMTYQWYLRQDDGGEQAGAHLLSDVPLPPVRRLARLLAHAPWMDALIRRQEYAIFLAHTRLHILFPDADLRTTLPAGYERLLEHIATHRWYLGEARQAEVPYEEAVRSWYQSVYLPLVQFLRQERLPQQFLQHTEADLYLWVSEGARRRREAPDP
ncbi:MAG: hypothetical protein Fur0018_04270 [Anaerolineales bacterium]